MKAYDFVTVNGADNYHFISEINGDVATVVGMKLTEFSDSIIFYSRIINVDKLTTVSDYFVNINGPLATLRDNMKKGIKDVYIMEDVIA